MTTYVNHLFFKESEELPMMKKHFKKLVNLALTAVMVMGMSTTTFAKESNNISNDTVTKTNNIIYSPEFPDAYIVTETSPAPNNYSLNNESKQLDTITATVFVEETLATDKNEDIYVSNSRLLSKDEVENIGIDNFSNINTMSTSRAAKRTYGKLTLTFSGSQSISGKSVSCKLNGNANWDFGAFTSSEKNPAIGKDFMGITWSGLFTTNSSSCSATDLTGKVTYPTMVDSIANGGRVWSFEESLFEDHFANYNKNINATINIKKNTMTGNGNTAEAVLKYIHTYQKTTGSVSMNVGSDSVSAGFTFSFMKNTIYLLSNRISSKHSFAVVCAVIPFCSFKYSYGDFCFNKYIVTIKNRKKIIQTQKNIFFCFLFILFTSFFI